MDPTAKRNIQGEVPVDIKSPESYNLRPPQAPTLITTGSQTVSFNSQGDNDDTGENPRPKMRRTPKEWLKKYFLDGQALNSTQTDALEKLSPNATWSEKFMVKHRQLVGVLIPFTLCQMIWWSCAIKYDFWSLFPDRFVITLVMIFGSMVGGMTSEGGGAVAFPVMTLGLSLQPSLARDFSLMAQSCGMSAATFTIFWMRVQLEWHAIICCFPGAILGIAIGMEFIDPKLNPVQKKLGFVCVWFSFAFALFLLNRYHKRKTFKTIPDMRQWKIFILFLTGVVGGIFSAIAGSGVDICSFSVVTLLFRVTEKTATPTSVVLMAGTSLVGVYWRQVMQQAISAEAYYYIAVCVPIVVLGAPLGSVFGSYFHRQVLAGLVYLIDTVALVSAFVLVPMTKPLIGALVGIILFGFLFFGLITYAGHRIMEGCEETKEELERVQVDKKDEISQKDKEECNGNTASVCCKPHERSDDIDLGQINRGFSVEHENTQL